MTDAINTGFSPSNQDGENPGTPNPAADLIRSSPSKRLEVLCALVAIVLTGIFAILSQQIEVRNDVGGIDPLWWPTLLGIGGLAISASLLIVVLSVPISRKDIDSATPQSWQRLAVVLMLVVLFVLTWPLLGFIPCSLIFLAAVTAVFGGRGWKALIVFPISITLFIYVLFHLLLKVPL